MTAKRKPKRTTGVVRARARPFQVYLDDAELRKLESKAAARSCSKADLVRHWINWQKRAKKKEAPASQQQPLEAELLAMCHQLENSDPRQVTLMQVLEAAEASHEH